MITKTKNYSKRDDKWLLYRLDYIWTKHFPDLDQKNKVYIKFGRFSKYRLGSIKLHPRTRDTHITITAMFRDESIPEAVVDQTIGHELVHYAQGFSSVHPKLHRYPHAGGVVNKEMIDRGMGHLYKSYKEWTRSYRRVLIRHRYG